MSVLVRSIQHALGVKETSTYDAETRKAVVEFQEEFNARHEANGSPQRLRTDGVCDAMTQEALGLKPKKPHAVSEIQRALGLPVTGNYDAESRAAVVEFQKDHNKGLPDDSPDRIREDGVVDPRTAKAMGIKIH